MVMMYFNLVLGILSIFFQIIVSAFDFGSGSILPSDDVFAMDSSLPIDQLVDSSTNPDLDLTDFSGSIALEGSNLLGISESDNPSSSSDLL